MKLIIAGSRAIPLTLVEELFAAWKATHPEVGIEETVTGCCSTGPDRLPYNLPYKVKEFPAEWGKYGKRGGPVRNLEMAKYADGLLLFWDEQSRGSFNMRANASKLRLPIYEFIIKDNQFIYREENTDYINHEEGLYL